MLHIINKSPFERSAFSSCLSHAKSGDSILMIEDAILAAVKNSSYSSLIKLAIKDKTLYVLAPDLYARGLLQARIIENIELVDYAGFVNLVVDNETNQSWL